MWAGVKLELGPCSVVVEVFHSGPVSFNLCVCYILFTRSGFYLLIIAEVI